MNDDNWESPKPGPVEPTPETVAPEQPVSGEVEGVKTGDLPYTEIEDGQRRYAGQEPVETTGDPTPTPEVK